MVGGEGETRWGHVASFANPCAPLEHYTEQMRDWQKSLSAETPAANPDTSVPEAKTAQLSPQITWSAVTVVLVFAILVSVRPTFVESVDREKPLEPRRLNWPLIFVSSLASGIVVLLLSVL